MTSLECSWNVIDVLADRVRCLKWAVENTVRLLEEDNTIPFIARYRKEQTDNMDAEKIRELKHQLDDLQSLQTKIKSVYRIIDKMGKMNRSLGSSLLSAESFNEVDDLYAPYKAGSKKTLAERARILGLEPMALQILNSTHTVNLQSAIKSDVKGLSTLKDVESGIVHIIVDILSKDKKTMDTIKDLCEKGYVTLESCLSRSVSKTKKGDAGKTTKMEPGNTAKKKDKADPEKFSNYHNFSQSVKNIKPHQVMAINRGENLKVLTVKIVIPENVHQNFIRFAQQKWIKSQSTEYTKTLLRSCIDEAYNKRIQPSMSRHYRSELTKQAERASVDVFSDNLRKLLLTPPVRGRVVLGVDPGYHHGCKYAVTSPSGCVLDSGVAYLHGKQTRVKGEAENIKSVMLKHRCETIAIGSGVACRETETFFSDHIKAGIFAPLNPMFCIVNEDGASVYSASPEAQAEMPDLDVSIRGAVSIARRLQDPMAELVKIEAKHIGVGMYQHDLAENKLKCALDGVVEDCCSFVGVDLNVCSEVLLRNIAGLTATRARNIIEWRKKSGAFRNRQQLNAVKGLGEKTFKQCAGFVRILPQTMSMPEEELVAEEPKISKETTRKRKKQTKETKTKKSKQDYDTQPNILDATCIHPESYHIAEKVIQKCGVLKESLGDPAFITAVKTFVQNHNIEQLANELHTGIPTMKLIIDGITQPLDHDIRNEFEKPLFKQGLLSIDDLRVGTRVSGRVNNTTHFGAFVDIGVGKNGLIHTSKMNPRAMKGQRCLQLGNRVEVQIMSIDKNRNRIGLELVQLL